MPQTEPFEQLFAEGIAAHRAGRISEAETAYRSILRHQPLHFDARHLHGVLLRSKGRPAEAVADLSIALAVNPESPDAYNNLANAFADLGNEDAMGAALKRALRLRPNFFEPLWMMAQLALRAADVPQAIEYYTRASAAAPSPAWHFTCAGLASRLQGDLDKAASAFAQAATADPTRPWAYTNWGEALEASARLPEALDAYRQGVARNSSAAACLEGAGRVLRQTFRLDEAVTSLKSALCLDPTSRGAALYLATTLFDLRHLDEAQRWFSVARTMDPSDEVAFLGVFNAALYSCDWGRWEPMREKALSRMRTGSSNFHPFSLLATIDSAADQLLAASAYSAHIFRDRPSPLWGPETVYRHDRVRIGYLAGDFHTHAIAYLIAELIEVHDRERFEIIGISYGPDDGSPIRQRLIGAFDRFLDGQFKTDREIAELIRHHEIDILIDLKGYTQQARAGILAYRAAPVQINYLGYPGTLGSPFHDYIIADATVIPAGEERWYSETVIRLPGAYQANDGKRALAPTTPTRSAEGLPDDAYVFCCFNNNWKIGREIFDIWMGLLRDIPESVLWLIRDNDVAAANLRSAAEQRGVNPARLIYTRRVPLPEHLARHRLADLFLDTLPYGAHTTASDAIFAGLPLLTCTGNSFAGRVAASLLTTVGVPELITTTLEDYAATARSLATTPDRLRDIRAKLVTAPGRQTLFDAKTFARGYEEALLRLL